jgi:hypothetical protein
LGGDYGTQLVAVEPDILTAVLNVPVGDQAIRGVLSPTFRNSRGAWLDERMPSLLNSPGAIAIGGVSVPGPFFNDNLPLRTGFSYQVLLPDGTTQDVPSPVINDVPGAMAIQEVFENAEWAMLAGDSLAYIPHVRKDPLGDVPPKSIIFQFDKGDQNVPNPISSAMLRAGDLADRATYYRHDLAFAEIPGLPTNGHTFMVLGITNPDWRRIALGAQEQVATFFASDGTEIIHPEPARFFETPINLPLPEGLNFILPSAPAPAPAQGSGSRASGSVPAEAVGGSPPIPGLFAVLQLEGTPAGAGAVIAASWTSQLATPLLDEGTTFGAGATFLAEHSLPENSHDADPWRLTGLSAGLQSKHLRRSVDGVWSCTLVTLEL